MAIKKDNILLPNEKIDMAKWSVIACDQFTSDKDYWIKLKKYIDNSPSTLNFIVPEAMLDSGINFECDKNIKNSISNGDFKTIEDSYILVDRSTPIHQRRLGLICCIDLERDYDFSKDSKTIIRASEKTIMERVIPRISVRKNAIVEFPHIMLLYDDRKFNIIENLYKNRKKYAKLYDFELNSDGGHIKGYRITEDLDSQFKNLLSEEYLRQTFDTKEKLLFIVGDGNHSLATAKTVWEERKKTLTEEQKKDDKARYCLVEICNINDDGIEFYPIHRVIYNFDKNIIEGLKNLYNGEDYIYYKLYHDGIYEDYKLPSNTPKAIDLVQKFIEKYISNKSEVKVDYVHDKQNVLSVCDKNKALGIFLPTLQKNDIFSYVINCGVLPQKSFSIGKSIEKRYYIEGRKIKD